MQRKKRENWGSAPRTEMAAKKLKAGSLEPKWLQGNSASRRVSRNASGLRRFFHLPPHPSSFRLLSCHCVLTVT
eukprot:5380797-Amphidinium_carterae.1